MRDILEVQMLRYSKIMLENCCNIRPSLSLQLWVATNEWSDPQTDRTIPFWLLSFFLQHYHSMLYLLPLQPPTVSQILDCVPGHTNIGPCQNFVHLVTGHTPGRINQNGTVVHSPLTTMSDASNASDDEEHSRGWWVLGNCHEQQRCHGCLSGSGKINSTLHTPIPQPHKGDICRVSGCHWGGCCRNRRVHSVLMLQSWRLTPWQTVRRGTGFSFNGHAASSSFWESLQEGQRATQHVAQFYQDGEWDICTPGNELTEVNHQPATTSNNAGSEDTGSLHYAILGYIPQDLCKDKLEPALLMDHSKVLHGFHQAMTVRLLCPMWLIEEFDQNPACHLNSLLTYLYALTTSAQPFYDAHTWLWNENTNKTLTIIFIQWGRVW